MKYSAENSFDYENGFFLTSEPYRLGNILAHYELYKKIVHLPGDVVELGVFKGNSLIQFATFRSLLENDKSRKIVGFDAFGEFPNALVGGGICNPVSDEKFIASWNKKFKDEFISREDILTSLKNKKIENIDLIQGDILKTLDEYVKSRPELRIALLHIDTDVYAPAKKGLEVLFDRVVKGGLVVFDDYGVIEGETLAVDEFFKDYDYVLEKFTFSHTKPSFLVKK